MISLDDFIVEVGDKSFPASGAWDKYIEEGLVKGLDTSVYPVTQAFKKFSDEIADWLEKQHGTRRWNGRLVNDSNRLQRRSGKGIESVKQDRKVTTGSSLDDVSAQQGLGTMGVHLEGATIRAKRSKYLTIPLPSACDRRGVPLKKSARDWPDTFVIKSKRGNLLIVQKQDNGSILPLYLLKSSVRIPARLSDFPDIWSGWAGSRLEKWIVTEMERALDNVRF